MKKILALILALVIALSLVACGEKAPAADDQQGADDGAASTGYETVELLFATTFNEMETSGEAIKYFTNYITEKSGGAITFDIKWGGTLAGTGEELSFLQAGAFDMSVLGQSQYSDVFALLNFPGQTDGSQQKCLDYFNHIVYENAETAALIEAQVEAQGVKMLGFMANGGNAFNLKEDVTTLADMAGKKIGIAMNQAAFESLGFSIYNMFPWDGYEALSKGMADFSYMATGPMIMLNWHEITPFFVDANQYTAGNYFTISLDRWNSLSAEAQALFEEAMAATTAYSVDLVDQQMAMVEGALAEKGGKLSSLNEADTKMFNDLLWNLAVKDSRALAANGNCSAEMETVLAACAAFLELPLN